MSIDRSRKADRALAPYAVDERQSRGRLVPEAPSPTRSLYARDRGRILHSLVPPDNRNTAICMSTLPSNALGVVYRQYQPGI